MKSLQRLSVNTLSLLLLLLTGPVIPITAQVKQAALIPGDFADPSIIRANGKYYATGTSSEWAPHFPIYVSAGLQQWKQAGYVFEKAPAWTTGSFWAPEYYFHNNTYYIYYTARRRSDNVSCIGVATSKYPDHGFTDHGVIVDYGKEAIDAFVFNDKGQLYITFKAYGLDNRPIELLGSRLSADGLRMEGDVFSFLKDDNRNGMEGQSILQHEGYYYLFYSSGGCCGNGCSYNVRVARSRKFKGPYEDYNSNPILDASEDWKCPGHGTFAQSPSGEQVYIYHAYNKATNVFTGREGMLATLVWDPSTGWPSFRISTAPIKNPPGIYTSFTEKQSSKNWQWDFRNSAPVVKQADGILTLSGSVKEGNPSGVVLTVRPLTNHFEMITTVVNKNNALKGLVFYGDANAALGIGVTGEKVEFWMVKENKRTILGESTIDASGPVRLKLAMNPDFSCEVFYRQGNGQWVAMAANSVQAEFLPQWDRSPRPGLHFKGTPDESAQFSDFSLSNL